MKMKSCFRLIIPEVAVASGGIKLNAENYFYS